MKTHVERSIQINASAEHVFKIISDLGQWNLWSPWIHVEPTCKTKYSGKAGEVNQTQEWEGEVIGSGKMTLAEVVKNQKTSMKLEFYKPFKSKADVSFSIQGSGNTCTVTWIMDSNMPIFLIFFKKMMLAFIGSDFDRGLRMLKEYAETGKVNTKSVFQGEKDFKGFQVVGKKTSCAISEMPAKMQTDFQALNSLKSQLPESQGAVAIYHKFDIPNGVCEYTAGLSYSPEQNLKTPAGLEITKYPAHHALTVDHYGPYRHLGNAWSMVVSYQRGKKKKLKKDIPMYEIYKTMPDGRPETEIYTQLLAPIKN